MRGMQRPFVLTLVGLIVGVVLGLLVAFLFLPPTDSQAGTTPRAEENLPSSDKDNDNQNTASGPTNLDSILKLDTASARRLALYELIEQKSGEQIADLLRQSFAIGTNKHLPSIQRLLFAGLARLNPELSLEVVWQSERSHWDKFFNVVFEEWAKSDPQLAAYSGTELWEPWKSKAFRTIFQTRKDLSDAERLELAETYGATRVLNELTVEKQLDEVLDEPKAAFELILQADIPVFRKSEMANWITARWIERAGEDNIGSMLSLVHKTFTEEQYPWRLVVAKLAANDPKLAWEQLSTLSLDAQKMLNDEVFKAWVEQDPTSAIHALNESEYMSAETWEVNSLYAAWARAVWHQLPEKIHLVPDTYRTNMLTQVVRELLADHEEPSDIFEQLKEIHSMGVNTTRTLETYFLYLSNIDPATAMQLASENLDERNFVLSSILRELAVVDVSKAMEFALQQPISSGAEQTVIGAMFSQGWLQKGLDLLPKLREGRSASDVYVSAGALLIEHGRISEAIELANELPEGEQSRYFESLAGIRSFTNSYLFVPILPQLPSEEIRSRVADQMLRIDRFIGTLTEDEIAIVRSHLRVNTD